MKRLFTLLCICAVLLALAACAGLGTAPEPAAPGSGEAAAADGETVSAASGLSGDGAEPGAVPALEQEAESGLLPLQPLPDNVTWAVEPALECTCIAPVTLARGDETAFYNTCGLINPDGLSMVTIDGKYGLIDHDGQWAVPCEFDDIYCGYRGKYALTGYTYAENGEEFIYEPGARLRAADWGETDPDGSNALVAVTGTSMNPILCYVPEEDKMYQWSNADESLT